MTFTTTSSQRPGITDPQKPFPGPLATGLLIVGFFVALAVMFAREEQRRLDDPVLKAERGEITIASTESLLGKARVAKALALIEAAAPAGTTVQTLRLTPTDIQATLAHPDGRQVNVRVDAALKLSQETSGGVRPTGPKPSQIDPAIPGALVKQAETKLKLKPKDLDYVLLNDFGGEPSWGLYYSEPPLDNDATAAFDGSDLRILGTPSAAQRKAARAAKAAQAKMLKDMAERRKDIERQLQEAAGQ